MSRDLRVRLLSYGFWLGLILLAATAALAISLGNPATIKRALNDSQLYQAAADLLADTTSGQLGPSGQPTIENAAKGAFTPLKIQQTSETTVDSVYRWLEGETPQPDFKIDLTPLRDTFVNNIQAAAVKHFDGLPPCTVAQLRSIDPQTADPLSLPCRPSGVSPQATADKMAANLTSQNTFVRQPVITAETLPKNQQGQTPFEAAASLPAVFQLMQIAPWIIAATCIILAGIVFILMSNSVRAAYTLAKSMLWAGVIVLGAAGLMHLVFSVLTQPGGSLAQSVEGSPQAYGLAFGRSLESSVAHAALAFGAAYTGIGWLTVALIRLLAARRQQRDTALPPTTTTPQI